MATTIASFFMLVFWNFMNQKSYPNDEFEKRPLIAFYHLIMGM